MNNSIKQNKFDSKVERAIFDLGKGLIEFTILRLLTDGMFENIFEDVSEKIRFEGEILVHLERIKNLNKLENKKGKLSISRICVLILSKYVNDQNDIDRIVRSTLENEGMLTDQNLLRASKLDLKLAIDSIYDDYVKYIDGQFNDEWIKSRIDKYYVLPKEGV